MLFFREKNFIVAKFQRQSSGAALRHWSRYQAGAPHQIGPPGYIV